LSVSARDRRLAILVMIAGLLAACGGKAKPSPSTTSQAGQAVVPEGFKVVKNKEAGFQIAYPEGWKELDFTSPDFAAALQGFLKGNPNLAPLATQATTLAQQGGKLLVADSATQAPVATTVNVIVQKDATLANASRKDLADIVKQSQALLGGTDLKITQLTVSGRPAVRVEAKNDKLVVGQNVVQAGLYVAGKKGFHVVTLITGQPEKDLDVLDKIIKSYRLL
jgi:hypothetical protein